MSKKEEEFKMKNIIQRADGRLEWTCEHSVGHTIYSDNNNYTHCCDFCCRKIYKLQKELKMLIDAKKEILKEYSEKIRRVLREIDKF